MGHPVTVSGKHLFIDPADGTDSAGEGYFSGHGETLSDAASPDRGQEGGDDGDTGRRSVFGYRAFGHMDVDIFVSIKIGRDLQGFGIGSEK